MKKLINTLCFVLITTWLAAQPMIDSNYIATKTKYFKVAEQKITGSGLKLIEKIIGESQFIAYGERHNSAATSHFMEALLPLLSKKGFDNFALEVGPHSVKRLKAVSKTPLNTVDNLRAFNTQYFDPQIQRELIPFFAGIEDAQFLQRAAILDMDLWGLDQEFYYSILFLTDDLLAQVKQHADYLSIKAKKIEADKKIREWLIKDAADKLGAESVFTKIAEEPAVIAYFEVFENGPQTAKEILEDIHISWDIYTRWRNGSHADRISYMRNNFMKNYEQKTKSVKHPKVFLKFGQVHTARQLSLGAYDLGNLVSQLANKNGTKATTINSWTRFYESEEGIADYMQKPHNYYPRLNLFFQFGKQDQWTIIDLQSIRKDYESGKISLPANGDFHKMLNLILNYDYQLILPLDKQITYNLER